MVYVDNLVDGAVLAELSDRAGRLAASGSPTPRPYEMNEIVGTVERRAADDGFDVADRQTRLPAIVGRFAEGAEPLVQRTGRYTPAAPRARRDGQDDRLRHLGGAGHELGYSPAVDLAEGMRRSIRWCVRQGIEL